MNTISYKCPNCGGGLEFDPATQGYKCEYCESGFALSELQSSKNTEPEGSLAVYQCPSCGAEITTDETTAATFCYYCHNPVVLSGKLTGDKKPDYIIPFQIDKETAVRIFTDWIKKKKFIPSAFFSPSQIEKLTGVYYPFLMYNCKINGSMEVEAKQVKRWILGEIEHIETKTYRIKKDGDMEVKHVLRNALGKAEGELPETVFPFRLDEQQEFSAGYLSGFVAESRDRETTEFDGAVTEEMKQFGKDMMRSSLNQYSSIAPISSDMRILSFDWKYTLFPVWTLTYRNQGQLYYFTLNGQTGQIHGALPVDKKRLVILFFSIFIPLFIILLGGSYLV